jgi:MFS family permease
VKHASESRVAAEWRQSWTVPLAAACGYSMTLMPAYALGPFMTPIEQTFGWSRAQISAGLTVVGIIGALFSVPIGRLVDRVGPRLTGLTGVVLMTVAFGLLGTATGTTTNWLLLGGFLAFANLGLQSTVWMSAVVSRFEASRGFALAVTLSGASVGGAVYPILATWLIGHYGWRLGFGMTSGVWAILVIPLVYRYFRGAQDAGGKQPVTAGAPAIALEGLSLAEGLRLPAFYKLFVAAGLFTFTVMGLVVHLVPILKGLGADPLAAAKIASLVGVFSIVGRLGTGILLDRLPAHFVGAAIFLLPTLGCALLFFHGASPMSQAAAAASLGLCLGAEVDVVGYLASRHFGLRNFGVLFGTIVVALAVGGAFGPLVAGLTFDWYGSYGRFLLLTMALLAGGGLALATLGQPRLSSKTS